MCVSSCNPLEALQQSPRPPRHDPSDSLFITPHSKPMSNSGSSSPPALAGAQADLRGGIKLASLEDFLLGDDTPAMGSCVSVRREPEPAVFRPAMDPGAGEVLASPPAVGGGRSGGGGSPAGGFDPSSTPEEAGLGFRSRRFGTKDEAFFDSQEWFESDCEDDYFSVNGDFAPSRSSTPNYKAGNPINPELHKAALALDGLSEAKSVPCPKKTLAELLQETMPAEPAANEHNIVDGKTQVTGKLESNETIIDQLPNSVDGTPCPSTADSINGGRTPDGDFRNGKEKRGKARPCCLPSLVYSLSFNEKKRTPSPRHHGGG